MILKRYAVVLALWGMVCPVVEGRAALHELVVSASAVPVAEAQTEEREYDICIYGGTSAGVIAAATASRKGKSVLLVEPGRHLGGMSSGGLGLTDIGNKYVITGLARDFYRRLGRHYGKLEQWIFEPKVAESIFNAYMQESNVDIWFESRLRNVEKEGNHLVSLEVEPASSASVVGRRRVRAKVFLDCSYEGDLMARAGVNYALGREGNDVYGETYNGVQLMRGHQFGCDIDPYVVPGDSASGLIWGISRNTLETAGTGDRKIQAYNFRICLTDERENMVPIEKPERYDASRYEILVRLNQVSPFKSVNDVFIWSLMPNHKTDINNRGAFSTDMIGANWDYPEASYEERARIWQEHVDYTKGLLYFLGHDERMPECIRKEMLRWGYPKDEYVDNGHWSHQLYVRESRRMIGELVMTQHHCQGREVCGDTIGWAAYTMDSHNCDRLVVDGAVRNEGNVEIGGFPPYPISYKAIVPRREEVDNLLVPVCLSASHIAYGSIRMEPVFMVLGQSAALAACMAADEGCAVQQIDPCGLRRELLADPLSDGSPAEILVDNDDARAVSVVGDWELEKDTYRSYGAAADFLLDDGGKSGKKSVRYAPSIWQSGYYEVYMYYPMLKDGSSSVTVRVADVSEVHTKVVRRTSVVVEGQTAGEWVGLGKYYFQAGGRAEVEISNEGADGAVAADAVLFLPASR